MQHTQLKKCRLSDCINKDVIGLILSLLLLSIESTFVEKKDKVMQFRQIKTQEGNIKQFKS